MTDFDQQGRALMTSRRKRIMVNFVEATRELILTEGVDGLSIRKISNEAGYNSATLYNYFRDLEHLTLFGSVCYLRDYVVALGSTLTPEMRSIDRFRAIYHCFNSFAFRYPDIFHNLFFGRYSDILEEVLQTYYNELFPEELTGLSENLRRMLVSGNIQERDRITMDEMVQDGFVAAEKAEIVLNLIAALQQHYIYQAHIDCTLDVKHHEQRFNEIFDYILETAK